MSVIYEDLDIEFEIKTQDNALDYIKANSIIMLRKVNRPTKKVVVGLNSKSKQIKKERRVSKHKADKTTRASSNDDDDDLIDVKKPSLFIDNAEVLNPEAADGSVRTSCSNSMNAQFSINPADSSYFVDKKALDVIKTHQQTVWTSIASFEDGLVAAISQGCKYSCSITGKYLKLSCQDCKKFQMWFADIEGRDMNSIESKDLRFRYFRSINQNHIRREHPDIKL